jgi:hypothetical protein
VPTTSKGLRYPASSDSPNGPTQIQNLASDVDTRLFTNAGVSGVAGGSAPTTGAALKFKTQTASITLNANGDGTVIYPGGAFATGVLYVAATHYGPGATPPSNDLEFVPWNAGLTTCNVRCYQPSGAVFGGTGVVASFLAIGV